MERLDTFFIIITCFFKKKLIVKILPREDNQKSFKTPKK